MAREWVVRQHPHPLNCRAVVLLPVLWRQFAPVTVLVPPQQGRGIGGVAFQAIKRPRGCHDAPEWQANRRWRTACVSLHWSPLSDGHARARTGPTNVPVRTAMRLLKELLVARPPLLRRRLRQLRSCCASDARSLALVRRRPGVRTPAPIAQRTSLRHPVHVEHSVVALLRRTPRCSAMARAAAPLRPLLFPS